MKAIEVLKRSLVAIYAFLVATLAIGLLIVGEFIDTYCEKHFTLPNAVVFLIDAGLIALGVLAVLKWGRRIERAVDKVVGRGFMLLLTVIFFLVQLYIAKNVYFLTGWDVQYVTKAAYDISEGGTVTIGYFMAYPNNLFLTYLFALVLKINGAVGIFPENDGVFAIVAFQCLLFAICAYLVYAVCYDLTKKKTASLLAFVIFFLLLGLSPWVVIPYSDGIGIIFPILIFRLWQLSTRAKSKSRAIVLWCVNGAVAFIAFKIKPQAFIMFIAVVIVEAARTVLIRRKDKALLKKSLTNIVACLLVFVIIAAAFSVFSATQTGIELNKETEIGLPHFFMMGLNGENHGGYCYDDVQFSTSFDTKEERDRENMRVAFERIGDMGFFGMIDHLVRKSISNFGDGTFAWGVEGNFYREILDEPNDGIAPFLRSFYYADGENYQLFEDSMQAIWLAVLFLSGAVCLYILKNRGRRGIEASVLTLSLVGLSIFEALFEARARYLMTFAPIFIIAAVIGLCSIIRLIDEKYFKTKADGTEA